MNISIKGAYGESNFGDDLLMVVFEDYINSNIQTKQLNFIGEENDYVYKFLVNSSYNNKHKNEMLIYGGGTQFFAFIEKYTIKAKLKSLISNSPIELITKLFSKFRSAKQKVEGEKVFLGFGLGPFHGNTKAINFAKSQLKNSFFIGVRDEKSFEYCSDWNLNAILGADVVFSSYFQKFLKTPDPLEVKDNIGIIVRDWDWDNNKVDYQNRIITFVDSNPQLDVTYIVFSKDKDSKWIEKISNKKHIIWEPEKMKIKDFLLVLNSFSTFITARYHGAIIAGLLGKKVICIEIEPKLKILTKQIPTFALWNNEFNTDELGEILNSKLACTHEDYIIKLRSKADEMLNLFVEKYKSKFLSNK
ncbi:polysaccharide pyruvyl transferase family protein [Pseudotamlana agarivorans]|uniref:polysaccharide pyruvyl transferase family protein n=1 Tax=Pseudotamlana agarivorans TaxID=481183 RepID=UPI0008311622|nr:polysaccharide pyruvyl transferase family protein [Tamlana agarivorans]